MSAIVGALHQHQIDFYRENGFARIEGVLTREEAGRWYDAALAYTERKRGTSRAGSVFTQLVNVWREDPVMAELTLDPRLGRMANALSGIPMRLWHDHLLIKEPRTSTPTEFHQDAPYWPHQGRHHALSFWIALCDVPPERGCMSFIPKSFECGPLRRQDLTDPDSLFEIEPELRYEPRVTLPLRAGDVTVHHSCCAHSAMSNTTDDPRIAHVVLFMDATVRYSHRPHPVTDPLGLQEGDPLDGELFPLAPE